MSTPTGPVDRRAILRGGALAAIALVIDIHWTARADAAEPAQFLPNALLRIDQAGVVTVVLPKTEMGQGVYTAIPMLIAEELDVDPAKVGVEIPRGDAKLFGTLSQDTGGSTSIRETFLPVRQAGANARAVLVAAAAATWHVPATECRTEAGKVLHAASGRTAPYGDLVARAATLPVPSDTPLKPADQFRVLGKDLRRLDSAGKIAGTATYGIDVVVPGMKIAALAQSPVLGGTLKSLDDSAALKVRGVRQIVRLPDAVAVVADHYWGARKGLEALTLEWTEGANATLDQAAIVATYAQASARQGMEAPGKGTADAAARSKAMTGAVQRVKAVYRQPFLAHAPMEPGNCVVHVRADGCEIWTGTQIPGSAREGVAKALGMLPEKVILHNYLMGGGFGRRLEADMIDRAIQVARQVSSPVKLIWSREEDMQHDLYRPFYQDSMEAGLGADGKPVAWTHRIAGSSIMARLYADEYKGVDADAVEGSAVTPYALPAQHVEWVRQESAVPTSWWRGVGGTRSAFVVESFIDELAAAAKADPIAYRRALLTDPRSQAVLDLVAERSGWAKRPAPGRGRGVAVINLWGTYMAQVVEVEKDSEGGIRVVRVTVAVDCGQPVNPLGIEAQVQGGIIFGLSAGLYGEITVAKGRIEQSNFHDYRILRMKEAPVIETHIVPSDKAVGGMGEPPVATVLPALANAVFALTGKRIRSLPIAKAFAV
ncbi:MAG TPA: xanthine dehydrogenase family protein molybdopterin-binding subunit [Sphingomonas sp.]|nr:xanthine dehydrogenase family protein molybdopterin-binding subunit [Sphingomonas sp.]